MHSLLYCYYLQNRFICVYSQLGKFPCFPRSITRNNQPLLLNIYIVCSFRTLLAIALIYISLLPMYGILSKNVTYILLYYFRNLRKNENTLCISCTEVHKKTVYQNIHIVESLLLITAVIDFRQCKGIAKYLNTKQKTHFFSKKIKKSCNALIYNILQK